MRSFYLLDKLIDGTKVLYTGLHHLILFGKPIIHMELQRAKGKYACWTIGKQRCVTECISYWYLQKIYVNKLDRTEKASCPGSARAQTSFNQHLHAQHELGKGKWTMEQCQAVLVHSDWNIHGHCGIKTSGFNALSEYDEWVNFSGG